MTRENKALEIAKLEGWELLHSNINLAIDLFSSFNGLMEIVERILEISPYYQLQSDIWIVNSKKSVNVIIKDTYHDLIIAEGLEQNSLVDALQNAVLFYLTKVKK